MASRILASGRSFRRPVLCSAAVDVVHPAMKPRMDILVMWTMHLPFRVPAWAPPPLHIADKLAHGLEYKLFW